MIYDKDSNNNRIASSRSIVLLITQSCNLNCKYCYETYKNNEIMTIDVCKKILLHEFQKASKDGIWSHLAISYLGGEPLLNFDLIKEVSEWLWRQKWPLAYSLDIRTNGTLLSDEMVTWFSRNKSRIDVALSLDGLNETQIINRTDLHVDYGFFSKNWPHRRIKVVLFRDSLPILAKTVTEMLEKNLNIEFDIAAGISWTSADAEIFESQLEDLMPFYENNLVEGRLSGLFPFNVENFFVADFSQYSFCLKHNNIVTYTPNGKHYGCHLLTPLVIGEQNAEYIKCVQAETLPVNEKCIKCPLVHLCKSCPAFNLKVCQNINSHAPIYTTCKMLKVQARACAELFLRNIQPALKNNVLLSSNILQCIEKALNLLNTIPEARLL